MKSPDTLSYVTSSQCLYFFWVTQEQLVLATEGSLQTVFQALQKGREFVKFSLNKSR